MNPNNLVLVKACEALQIDYKSLHSSGNLIKIILNGIEYYFSNWSSPLNTESMARICRDKEYQSLIFSSQHRIMPETISVLSPLVEARFKEEAANLRTTDFVKKSVEKLGLPLIVKANSKSGGCNVFSCQSLVQVESALDSIFDPKSKDYDYVALLQRKISSEKEFRLVCLDGKLSFAYSKDTSTAKGGYNISPLHQEGAKTILLDKPSDKLLGFVELVSSIFTINYCGMDVIEDEDGEYWLIELNSSPSFRFFIRDNGDQKVQEFYTEVLRSLIKSE